MRNNSPIFILGVPRSGTTLLATLLNQHTQVHVDKNALALRICKFFNRTKGVLRKEDDKEIVTELSKDQRLNDYFDDKALRGSAIGPFINDQLQSIASKNGKMHYVDKSPDAVEQLERLLSLFPESKFIFMVRDPRSNIVSLMQRQYLSFKRALRIWVSYNAKIINYYDWIGGNRIMIIRYEDLVSSTEGTVRDLTHFVGIDYENQMVQIGDVADLKQSDSYVKPFIDTSTLSAWKTSLKKKSVRFIEQYACRLMDYFNYEQENQNITAKPITYWKEAFWDIENAWGNLFISRRTSMQERKLQEIKIPFKKRLKGFISTVLLAFLNGRLIVKSPKR